MYKIHPIGELILRYVPRPEMEIEVIVQGCVVLLENYLLRIVDELQIRVISKHVISDSCNFPECQVRRTEVGIVLVVMIHNIISSYLIILGQCVFTII